MRKTARGALVGLLALTTLWPAFSGAAAELPSIEPTPMSSAADWPPATNVTRPWTRWWWLGSAVDADTITRLLETYRAAGLGGVEITALYGVRGAESREIPYLSPEWVELLRHSVREAKRLDMQIDLPTGSGWRTGGPSVTEADANTEVVIDDEPLAGGSRFNWTFDQMPPLALVAYGPEGQVEDLGARIRARAAEGSMEHVEWIVPPGKWTLYTVTERWSRDNVKRPAPGGEGRNVNPLARQSIENYLDYFGKALGNVPQDGIRAQFHDSYEYEGNWCPAFFDEFAKRRGYKLEEHLPALDGKGDPDEVARVKCDYRATVADLVRDHLIVPWTEWSHEHGMRSRNQSHGSPANWLDLYEACDIPEIESFGRLVGGDTNRLVFMFAPSAAHVTGKPLVSAESATWIEEHFNETLGQVKEVVDRLFLAGVNHVIYHGTIYSPDDAAWPGWLFYASAQLNPNNPLWREFTALNEYVTRCQSVLQSTQPNNDILLYWPIHDFWHDPKGLRKNIQIHNSREWLDGMEFGRVAKWLDERGNKFDYVSDRQLAKCVGDAGRVQAPSGARYQIVIVPGAKFLPLSTLQSVVEIAKAGGTVAFLGSLPSGPPGIVSQADREKWDKLMTQVKAGLSDAPKSSDSSESALDRTRIGQGQVLISPDWAAPLIAAKVRQDWLGSREHPLRYHRRVWSDGNVYFLKNDSEEPFDGPIAPAVDFSAAVLMDPMDGRVGAAEVKPGDDGKKSFRVQLAPHQSLVVKTYRKPVEVAEWKYRDAAGEATVVDGEWKVEFIAGGPELPSPYTTRLLESWTKTAGTDGERFAGTARYTIDFTPDCEANRYLLDLGNVADAARVELNGRPVGTLVGPPFEIEIGPFQDGKNRLTVEVTNVAANRIRDLDRRGVPWRIFKDINFVNINYRPFDASNWPVRDAGLMGPVTLRPLAD